MYLKSLTIRGFKSFASATTLNFEQGITAVVGPNGSGKSNVVDAIAWVMGEQGAKTLRGGTMDDVIFKGSAGRAPLGRAEVVLTIDNADGALPIDYAEVTISRTLFRNGGSEYAINGNASRLLDVQELLSDSGIGREMHVIVGQGQVASVLSATPEDRRGFIEEAAGVLKHRRRKEKAERKLDATQANMLRLQDLTNEIRRQLKPLARQADVARKAQTIQAELRDAKLRILADDLTQMRINMMKEVADETILREKQAEVESKMNVKKLRESELERLLLEATPRVQTAQQTWFKLASLRERFFGTRSLAMERAKLVKEEIQEQTTGADPEALEKEAKSTRENSYELQKDVEVAKNFLSKSSGERNATEELFQTEQARHTNAIKSAADKREEFARLNGQVNAAKSRIEARASEATRLEVEVREARERAEKAKTEFLSLESQIAGLDGVEKGLDTQYEQASKELAAADAKVAELEIKSQETARSKAALTARAEALQQSLLEEVDGGDSLLNSGDDSLIGSLSTLLRIESGWESAVAVALGDAANAIAAKSVNDAIRSINKLKNNKTGRAAVLLADALYEQNNAPAAPPFSRNAIELVNAPYELQNALKKLLRDVVIVETLEDAQEAVRLQPRLTAVTRDGDKVTSYYVIGGTVNTRSRIEAKANVEKAETERDQTSALADQLRFELQNAKDEQKRASEKVEAALALLYESDAELAAIAEKLAALGEQNRSSQAEAERLDSLLRASHTARADDERVLREIETRLADSGTEPEEVIEIDASELERLRTLLETTRAAEVDARLAMRTAEERLAAVVQRAEQLERTASSERVSRSKAMERREQRRREAHIANAVFQGVETAMSYLENSLITAEHERDEATKLQQSMEQEVQQVRHAIRDLGSELERLVDTVHRDEVARMEQRLRIEQIELKGLEDYGIEADSLLKEYGPDQLVPQIMHIDEDADPDMPIPAPKEPEAYVREKQEKRALDAEKKLALLGRINPLALEEFSALEERNQFLTEQLEDVKKTRKDLLEVIAEVEQRVQEVFNEAYKDVAREFETVLPRLFPGGEGRLVLTDPENMLTTGIDIEVKPQGKRYLRLSLLSGGERSLAAVAFLVALFKARPSPFYILDEVEAALDDANLGRLLELYEELRQNSQLIVVTHQKRTMEICDSLYGVSMRGDGISTVVSQRIREVREDQPA